ncbi:histidinol-phosphate transaminase [Psychromonas sp. Urea-02u-13]|uniref:histidinol-phosphate transaminase n=1 Tax=Psychromonas sp. Urea-02u-13 TaxID=2058326 RepID=UPI000C345105|nr:histidinol-phosphate transaminase [Psychromonas sp. Urea-02u-13]PKG40027.1 histidinol-phosphate transaminase [Psychromonas sp. Urea-02u-13]
MSDIKHLARGTVQALTPYLSARRIGGKGDVWLNANEAPDCSEYQLDSSNLNRYPEFQPPTLIQAYADYASINGASISPEQVLTSRGADESIEILIRTFCEPASASTSGDSILICPPTYGMYAISAETCGVQVDQVALDTHFDVDYVAVEQAVNAPNSQVKIVFLCAPNNPTGNMLDKAKLVDLLHAAKGKALIVADEAYIEFCPTLSQADLINNHENLVITRTLSKAFALASIRCGFTLAQASVIEMMSKVIAPYPVPDPVAQIATQALSIQGLEVMRERVAILNNNRMVLANSLQQLDCVTELFPATGNFVLVRFTDAKKVWQAFSENGVIMRDFASKDRLENCIRITIGNIDEMQVTLKILNSL